MSDAPTDATTGADTIDGDAVGGGFGSLRSAAFLCTVIAGLLVGLGRTPHVGDGRPRRPERRDSSPRSTRASTSPRVWSPWGARSSCWWARWCSAGSHVPARRVGGRADDRRRRRWPWDRAGATILTVRVQPRESVRRRRDGVDPGHAPGRVAEWPHRDSNSRTWSIRTLGAGVWLTLAGGVLGVRRRHACSLGGTPRDSPRTTRASSQRADRREPASAGPRASRGPRTSRGCPRRLRAARRARPRSGRARRSPRRPCAPSLRRHADVDVVDPVLAGRPRADRAGPPSSPSRSPRPSRRPRRSARSTPTRSSSRPTISAPPSRVRWKSVLERRLVDELGQRLPVDGRVTRQGDHRVAVRAERHRVDVGRARRR